MYSSLAIFFKSYSGLPVTLPGGLAGTWLHYGCQNTRQMDCNALSHIFGLFKVLLAYLLEQNIILVLIFFFFMTVRGPSRHLATLWCQKARQLDFNEFFPICWPIFWGIKSDK